MEEEETKRDKLARMARETVEATTWEEYEAVYGTTVPLHEELNEMSTRLFKPEDFIEIDRSGSSFNITDITVTNIDVMSAAKQISDMQISSDNLPHIGILNFASATHPGGGFLRGANAQEEAIARSTALYKSLMEVPEYYLYNRDMRDPIYSNDIIYTYSCPVIRDTDENLTAEVWPVDICTCAAPNLSRLETPPDNIRDILKYRMTCILRSFASNDCYNIVLGAWGCGVFKNDPVMVSELFKELLDSEEFTNLFKIVIFAILDNDEKKIITPFETVFK